MSPRFLSLVMPRDKLFALAGGFGAAVAVWLLVGVIDLHDGRTWEHEGRSGPWYVIDKAVDPSDYRSMVMFRYVLPVTLLGTISLVCLLGAFVQPKGKTE